MPELKLVASGGGSGATEDSGYSTTSGSSYTSLTNNFTQKTAQTLVAIRVYAQTTGSHTVTLKQGATELASKTETLTATGWNTITLSTPVALSASTAYSVVITRPNAQAVYLGFLFNGTYWQNTLCLFGATSFSFTVAMGLVYGGTAYAEDGTAIYGPFTLPDMEYQSSYIEWAATVPDDTAMTVYAGFSVDESLPGAWGACTNEDDIPGITGGVDMYIKVAMSTGDTSKTPSMTVLDFGYVGEGDPTNVRITLTEAGRLKYPQGSVNASYASSIGNLKNATGTLAVPTFSEPFTPDLANIVFNPMDHENIEVGFELNIDVNAVAYVDTKNADETIELAANIDVIVYDASNNPV